MLGQQGRPRRGCLCLQWKSSLPPSPWQARMCHLSSWIPSSGCFCKRSHATRGLRVPASCADHPVLESSSCRIGVSASFVSVAQGPPSCGWGQTLPLLIWWAGRCLHLGYCEERCPEHWCSSVWTSAPVLECVSRSGISRPFGNSVCLTFGGTAKSAFHSSCAVLHFGDIWGFVFPRILTNTFLAILLSVTWSLVGSHLHLPLVADDLQPLVTSLLAVCTSLRKKSLHALPF